MTIQSGVDWFRGFGLALWIWWKHQEVDMSVLDAAPSTELNHRLMTTATLCPKSSEGTRLKSRKCKIWAPNRGGAFGGSDSAQLCHLRHGCTLPGSTQASRGLVEPEQLGLGVII